MATRGPTILQRLIDSMPLPRVKPFQEMGTLGVPVFGGYIVSLERNPQWVGRQKYTTASDILTNVSIVAASVHYFLNLIARPKWTVVPADDKDPDAVRLAEFVDDVIHSMNDPWSQIVRRCGMYRFHGFTIQEWTAKRRADGQIGFSNIEQRSQYTVEQWMINDDGSVLGVWQRSPQTNQLLGIPRGKMLYIVDDTISDSPEGLGIFRHMAEPYNRFKRFLELETIGYERDLRGTPIGRAPLSAIKAAVKAGKITEAEATRMINEMEQFVQNQVKSSSTGMLLDSVPYTSVSADGPKVATIPQWDMDLLQGSSTSLEALAKAIERVQLEMARVIGTEGLMLGDGSGGSRALSEDKSRNLYLVGNAVLQNMAARSSKDLIDPLWSLNAFPEELKPWFQSEDVTFRDIREIAAAMRDVATAGAPMAPDDPAIDDLRDLMGVSRPNTDAMSMAAMGVNPEEDEDDMQLT